jgi:hypothetical protein
MNKKLIVTFDYELFLGSESGHVLDALIKPTNLILDVLKKHKQKSIFFVDATYLYKLEGVMGKYHQARTDYNLIKGQIKSIIDEGHYVYLHIHPHWINAIYNTEKNTWDLSNTDLYSFSKLSEEQKIMIFNSSYKSLTKIDSRIQIDGFRAGGLYIQPFECFIGFLKSFSIKNEFSVLPGYISNQKSISFDFSKSTTNDFYNFEKDVVLEKEDGTFTAFPISVFKMNLLQRLINSFWYRFILLTNQKRPMAEGKGTSFPISFCQKNFFESYETFSIELMNKVKLAFYLQYLKKNQYLHFISHPKLVNTYQMQMFDLFLGKVSKKYKIISDYKKFCD